MNSIEGVTLPDGERQPLSRRQQPSISRTLCQRRLPVAEFAGTESMTAVTWDGVTVLAKSFDLGRGECWRSVEFWSPDGLA